MSKIIRFTLISSIVIFCLYVLWEYMHWAEVKYSNLDSSLFLYSQDSEFYKELAEKEIEEFQLLRWEPIEGYPLFPVIDRVYVDYFPKVRYQVIYNQAKYL